MPDTNHENTLEAVNAIRIGQESDTLSEDHASIKLLDGCL